MNRSILMVAFALSSAAALRAQPAPAPAPAPRPVPAPAPAPLRAVDAVQPGPWDAWLFLAGDWTGSGSGSPGQGSGKFSFKFDLGGKVLIRHNVADYPATKERPAFRHEDLMTIYPDPAGSGMKADYFDNEGHVIHYSATAEGGHWIFLSDPAPGPRFRLTYSKLTGSSLEIKFEIAGPQPDAPFKTYITATATRMSRLPVQ
jgi:hypothetical protein